MQPAERPRARLIVKGFVGGVKNRPGMVLKPSKKDPTKRRWQQTTAKEPQQLSLFGPETGDAPQPRQTGKVKIGAEEAEAVITTIRDHIDPETGQLSRGMDYYRTLLRPLSAENIRRVGEWARKQGGFVARFVGGEVSAELLRRSDQTKPTGKRQVMGTEADLVEAKRVDGVDYELYRAGDQGIVRIHDADSGQPVGITRYPRFEDARKAHAKAIPPDKPEQQGKGKPSAADIAPWELSEAERKAEIQRLRQEHREALAVPLASEGGISPAQMGRMSQRQRDKWQRLAQQRMKVEARIRDLQDPEPAKAHHEKQAKGKASGRAAALANRIRDLRRLGMGKRGKVKPSYQRGIDEARQELRALADAHPELAEKYANALEPSDTEAQPKGAGKSKQSREKPAPDDPVVQKLAQRSLQNIETAYEMDQVTWKRANEALNAKANQLGSGPEGRSKRHAIGDAASRLGQIRRRKEAEASEQDQPEQQAPADDGPSLKGAKVSISVNEPPGGWKEEDKVPEAVDRANKDRLAREAEARKWAKPKPKDLFARLGQVRHYGKLPEGRVAYLEAAGLVTGPDSDGKRKLTPAGEQWFQQYDKAAGERLTANMRGRSWRQHKSPKVPTLPQGKGLKKALEGGRSFRLVVSGRALRKAVGQQLSLFDQPQAKARARARAAGTGAIAHQPGMALLPSHKDPRKRRWQQTTAATAAPAKPGHLFETGEKKPGAQQPAKAVVRARKLGGKGSRKKVARDVGEKIGMARKDLAAARATFLETLAQGDLDQLEGDAEAAAKAVNKANVWKLDVQALRDQGYPASVAYYIQQCHRAISPKPAEQTPEGRARYLRTVKAVQGALLNCRTLKDTRAAFEGWIDQARTEQEALRDRGQRAFVSQTETWRDHEALGKRWHKLFTHQGSGTPYYRARSLQDREKAGAEDWSWAETKRRKGGGGKRRTAWMRAVPEEAVREGGRQVDVKRPEDYLDLFGFRGVEWGNWMDDETSKDHMVAGAAALSDLADVLGIELHDITWHGRLALAFGARGGGKASAHYEPHKRVINLTKWRGGGALAHEWGHFFDHMLGRVAGANGPKYLSQMMGGRTELDPNVYRAMQNLQRAMNKGQSKVTFEAQPTRYARWPAVDAHFRSAGGNVDKALASIRREYPGTKLRQMKNIGDYLAKKAGVKSYSLQTNASEFATSAQEMGDYWRRPQEMFARCFESFIEDTLKAKGRTNTYLVSGTGTDYVDQQPYPMGEERKRIVAAVGELVAAVKAAGALAKAFQRAEADLTKTWADAMRGLID